MIDCDLCVANGTPTAARPWFREHCPKCDGQGVLLTRDEVCKRAGLGVGTLTNYISAGMIEPAVRMGTGGRASRTAYRQNLFTVAQADRLKAYMDSLKQTRRLRRELR